MDFKLIVPEDTDHDKLKQVLDSIEGQVNAAMMANHRKGIFQIVWEEQGDDYKINMTYAGEGRIKNFMLKRALKMAFKRFDKRIKVK